MKQCLKCKEIRSLEHFWKSAMFNGGRDIICSSCRRKVIDELREERLSSGLCPRCGKPSLLNLNACLVHWFVEIGARIGRAKESEARQLKELWEAQGKRCPYSDDELIPGNNMSLDHIKPTSRFPELAKRLSNMQWVTKTANQAKQNMTHDEFVVFCKYVSEKSYSVRPNTDWEFNQVDEPLYRNKTWLREHYCEKQMSAYAIADMLGVSTHAIYYHLRKFDIPRRNLSDAFNLVWDDEEYKAKMAKTRHSYRENGIYAKRPARGE